MQNKVSFNTKRLAGLALLIAIVVVLQLVGGFIKIGAVSVTLVLIPIVIGAAVYGASAGAALGLAFGAVTLINAISGADAGANMLWLANPFITALVCLLKGGAAGFFAGLIYKTVSKKNIYLGVFCAAVVCPVVNTGIFLLTMFLFFQETLTLWAGGTHIFFYAFTALAGVNFILELAVNIILCPAIIRIINAVKKA